MKRFVPEGDDPVCYVEEHKIRYGGHMGDYQMKDGLIKPNDDVNKSCWIQFSDCIGRTTGRIRHSEGETSYWVVCCEQCLKDLTGGRVPRAMLRAALDRSREEGFCGRRRRLSAAVVAPDPKPARPHRTVADLPDLFDSIEAALAERTSPAITGPVT